MSVALSTELASDGRDEAISTIEIARELKAPHVLVLARRPARSRRRRASAVQAPTLLIVGSDDHEVIALNRKAMTRTKAIHICLRRLARALTARSRVMRRGEQHVLLLRCIA